MKAFTLTTRTVPALLALFSTLAFQPTTVHAQGTAFTYNGRLNDGGSPANGNYDLQFTVFDAVTNGSMVGAPVTNSPTTVSNGLFSVVLDFGVGVFPGADRWLEIGVRTNGGGSFFTLIPRLKITAVPYAITASNLTGTVPSTGLSGTYVNAVNFTNAGNGYSGSAANLSALNASQLNVGTVADARLSANVPLLSGSPNFSGNVTSQGRLSAAQLNAGSNHSLSAAASLSSIGGGRSNSIVGTNNFIGAGASNGIANGNLGAFIGSGLNNLLVGQPSAPVTGMVIVGGMGNRVTNSMASFIGAGQTNSIGPFSDNNVVVGGFSNSVGMSVTGAAILGGVQNSIGSNASESVITGGGFNTIGSGSFNSAIVAGYQNTIEGVAAITPEAWYSFIGAGTANLIQNGVTSGFIGGGDNNLITSNSINNFIGGGGQNINSGGYSVIAGGQLNLIGSNSAYSAVGGGNANHIQPNSSSSVIGGGLANVVSAPFGVVSGGFSNTVSGDNSVIPGGFLNTVSSSNSLAAGYRAKALHSGSFVWSDFTGADFPTTTNNQFRVRATGGAEIVGNLQSTTLHTTGAAQFGSAQVDGFVKLTSSLIFGYTNGATITPVSSYMRITGSSTNAVTLSGTTAIADITSGAGTLMILQGLSDLANVTINDGANTALGAPSRALGLNDTLTLLFDGAVWIELSYVNH